MIKNNKRITNPTGKGGFRDNPENRNQKGRPKLENSFKAVIDKLLAEDTILKDGGAINTLELLMRRIVMGAISGNTKYSEMLMKRYWPETLKIEGTGNEGEFLLKIVAPEQEKENHLEQKE